MTNFSKNKVLFKIHLQNYVIQGQVLKVVLLSLCFNSKKVYTLNSSVICMVTANSTNLSDAHRFEFQVQFVIEYDK